MPACAKPIDRPTDRPTDRPGLIIPTVLLATSTLNSFSLSFHHHLSPSSPALRRLAHQHCACRYYLASARMVLPDSTLPLCPQHSRCRPEGARPNILLGPQRDARAQDRNRARIPSASCKEEIESGRARAPARTRSARRPARRAPRRRARVGPRPGAAELPFARAAACLGCWKIELYRRHPASSPGPAPASPFVHDGLLRPSSLVSKVRLLTVFGRGLNDDRYPSPSVTMQSRAPLEMPRYSMPSPQVPASARSTRVPAPACVNAHRRLYDAVAALQTTTGTCCRLCASYAKVFPPALK
ncbi:hypothetical protein GGX14DRAFT_404647 [Mycena pura]|uniref:Uncharacterized protein n=1 Tax=Mycena pura TaxID=153505 RepID=A0AAD6UTX4_9AGAR|nr:hypothetical protein GGX14DRAFT_404647 [Mycena pura]